MGPCLKYCMELSIYVMILQKLWFPFHLFLFILDSRVGELAGVLESVSGVRGQFEVAVVDGRLSAEHRLIQEARQTRHSRLARAR
jgi:hypothetical protein